MWEAQINYSPVCLNSGKRLKTVILLIWESWVLVPPRIVRGMAEILSRKDLTDYADLFGLNPFWLKEDDISKVINAAWADIGPSFSVVDLKGKFECRAFKLGDWSKVKEAIFSMNPTKAPGLDGFQSAFVLSRQIFDNVMVSFESLYSLASNKQGKRGQMALKLDMSKVYDHIEWLFIRTVMVKKNFPSNRISLIMDCISSSMLSILLNGQVVCSVTSSKGYSHIWRSLTWGRLSLAKRLRWRVGERKSIRVFKDRWIPQPCSFKPVTFDPGLTFVLLIRAVWEDCNALLNCEKEKEPTLVVSCVLGLCDEFQNSNRALHPRDDKGKVLVACSSQICGSFNAIVRQFLSLREGILLAKFYNLPVKIAEVCSSSVSVALKFPNSSLVDVRFIVNDIRVLLSDVGLFLCQAVSESSDALAQNLVLIAFSSMRERLWLDLRPRFYFSAS
ncbi:hypothetical protein Ddye_025870 [Dipteronia dyeriana]|uniref:Reverse transcriptase n=1 Tax=Dipteronia dyeriana TaxID=168575 RepID=A0AAD9TL35_9ROSI|nr:hypothetical protein Ddye_025870 [Dipteronia dyeriana]